jgi:hypothetical protein
MHAQKPMPPLRRQAGGAERAGGRLAALAKPRNAQEQESKKFPTKFVMPAGLAARLGKDWDFIDKDDKVCRHRLGEFKESETPAPVGPSLPNFCILAVVHRASSQQPATQEKRRHRGLWD